MTQQMSRHEIFKDTPPARTKIMSMVRSRGNLSTEISFRSLLRVAAIKGWRRHLKTTGKPDFAFPKMKVAVFIDGDFWHGNLANDRMPKTNVEYWSKKIERNRARDKAVSDKLKGQGWTVLRFWESELKKAPESILAQLKGALALRR